MADLIITAAGQNLTGTDNADFFTLQTGDGIKAYGLAGNDTVFINSTVAGTPELDNQALVSLGGGADSVYIEDGVYGSSTVLGGAGGDTITIDNDFEYSVFGGGDGSDVVTVDGNVYSSTMTFGAGADKLTVSGYLEYSVAQFGSGADTLAVNYDIYSSKVEMGGGADVVAVSAYVEYSDVALGAGTDKISITGDGYVYSSNIQGGGNADTITMSDDNYLEYSLVRGGAGADLISIGSAYYSSTIAGDAGADTISVGGNEAEYISVLGGDGADSINMSAGGDTYEYYNTVVGGLGADTIVFGDSVAQYVSYSTAAESNVANTDLVDIAESAYLTFGLNVTGLYSFGSDATPFRTNGDGYATFNQGDATLSDRLSILDDNTSVGQTVLFDAVDADGALNRYVFVQGGSSGSGTDNDYLVQVKDVTYIGSFNNNELLLSAS